VTDSAYLRFPSVRGDLIAFVAEDDVWLAPLAGGRAWRLTADRVPVAGTQLSPDGSLVAFTSRREGVPDVHVVAVDGGPASRLTYWGDGFVRVLGWTEDGRVLAASTAAAPFRSRSWAYAVPLDGGPALRLPYGPVTAIAAGPGGATVLGVDANRRSAAAWKRYRGGQAGKLWIDRDGSGQFVRLLPELAGQLEDPGWIGDRVTMLSDHEGWGNVYSCRTDGTDLRRHTDHGDAYARAATTDGQHLIYQCLGELWLLEDLGPAAGPRRLDVQLAGQRRARVPYPIDARDGLGDVAPDHTGRASAVEVRGTIHWLTHRDGPAQALADQPGVRARLPQVLGGAAEAPAQVAWVTDAEGDDSIEVRPVGSRLPGGQPAGGQPLDGQPLGGQPLGGQPAGGQPLDGQPLGGQPLGGQPLGGQPGRRLAAGQLGRVLELTAAPDGSQLAAASHDGRLLLIDVGTGAVRTVDSSDHGEVSGLAFSPDSRWLAWSHPGPTPLRQIRLAQVEAGPEPTGVIEATALRFSDTDPVFTLDGKHLAFLSARTFDPVYDEHVFDMSFPVAIRPHLLPLAATTPSPFDPQPGGRPAPAADSADGTTGEAGAPPEVTVDVDGLDQRAVPVPVPAGRYGSLRAAREGLLWLQWPVVGVLGDGHADADEQSRRPRLQRYDLRKRRLTTLAEAVDTAAVTGDGKWVLHRDGSELRLAPADRRVDPSDDEASESTVDIELDRLRVRIEPAAQWRQMFDEAGRLMRDNFWIADFAGVDWAGVLDRYRPVLDRIGSRDDLSDLLWEVQGELGSSHAYESPPEHPVEATHRLGHLGADLARDDAGRWRVERVLPGESSAPAARSPLAAPGVAVRAGDVIVAVDGRPVDATTGPAPLLVGAANVPVELTVERDGSDAPRQVVVEPLPGERALRYHAWVADRRAAVHAASGGRVGYLHIPDMTAEGWAQLHRDLHLEVAREALVVDVRDNGGGHVSELVLEKLSRAVQGWDTVRHGAPEPYPRSSPRGPLVAVANESAGSDGDIVVAMFKQLGLGPVVGTRTWGGVIGIDMRYRLVDGTLVTQPRFSFWFRDLGWGVENYGVDPDVEVPYRPQDWAAGVDPQLDTAVRLALEALASRPASSPPDPATRPSRLAPALPPRAPA
jgi:tricorn protease